MMTQELHGKEEVISFLFIQHVHDE